MIKMSLETLLSRLQKVKRTSSNSWIACCPAHDDKSPSLTIKDAGNGMLLMKCFASCGTEDVLGAIGMEFKDIMPEKVVNNYVAPSIPKIYATDALRAIQFESRILMLAFYSVRRGAKLNDVDMARCETAMERINTAVEMV